MQSNELKSFDFVTKQVRCMRYTVVVDPVPRCRFPGAITRHRYAYGFARPGTRIKWQRNERGEQNWFRKLMGWDFLS